MIYSLPPDVPATHRGNRHPPLHSFIAPIIRLSRLLSMISTWNVHYSTTTTTILMTTRILETAQQGLIACSTPYGLDAFRHSMIQNGIPSVQVIKCNSGLGLTKAHSTYGRVGSRRMVSRSVSLADVRATSSKGQK